MYRTINILAFFGCIAWLYIDPTPEPVVVLLATFAAFFRDDIHGVIGKNVFTLTPKNKLIRDFDTAKYSFTDREFINPRILNDLIGWLSDSGDQIVSVNLTEANKSNRYFGELSVIEKESEHPVVSSESEEGRTSYQYIGHSFSGVHLVQVWSNSGGSGVFGNILLVTLSLDSALEHNGIESKKISRFIVKHIGTIPLGDRYEGKISYRWGILTIPACQGCRSLREKTAHVLVL